MKKLILISAALVGFNAAAQDCSNDDLTVVRDPLFNDTYFPISKKSVIEFVETTNDKSTSFDPFDSLGKSTCSGLMIASRVNINGVTQTRFSVTADRSKDLSDYSVGPDSVIHFTTKNTTHDGAKYIRLIKGVPVIADINMTLTNSAKFKDENLSYEYLDESSPYLTLIESYDDFHDELYNMAGDFKLSRP